MFVTVSLYTKAMQQPLPLGSIRFLTKVETDEFDLDYTKWDVNGSVGYFLCVDLEFDESLHVYFNWLPPLPYKKKIYWKDLSPRTQSVLRKRGQAPLKNESSWFVERLVADLEPRIAHWVHFSHLKTVLELGVTFVKLRKVIKFDQTPFMVEYLNTCIEGRQKATSTFHRNLCKLSMNANFGKFLGKRINFKIFLFFFF